MANDPTTVPSSAEIAINARFKLARVTGVQRYAWEVSKRLTIPSVDISPRKLLSSARSHLWEQFAIPASVGARLLWSPGNTGPLLVKRQVVTIHDLAAIEHPEWFSGRFSQWYKWLLPKLALRAQHILTDAHYTKERFVSLLGVDPDKVTVIPLSVDHEAFYPQNEKAIAEVRRKYNIGDSPYFATLGSLEPRKNLRNMIAAWNKVSPQLSADSRLVIIGGPGKTEVFAKGETGEGIPNITRTGYVPDSDVPALLSGASALLYVSLYEGFGFPVIEGMACGVPVITSNLTSIPEVAGSAAILLDPQSVDGIAKAIYDLAIDPALAAHFRVAGLGRAKQFSWERCAGETEAVLVRQAERS